MAEAQQGGRSEESHVGTPAKTDEHMQELYPQRGATQRLLLVAHRPPPPPLPTPLT